MKHDFVNCYVSLCIISVSTSHSLCLESVKKETVVFNNSGTTGAMNPSILEKSMVVGEEAVWSETEQKQYRRIDCCCPNSRRSSATLCQSDICVEGFIRSIIRCPVFLRNLNTILKLFLPATILTTDSLYDLPADYYTSW